MKNDDHPLEGLKGHPDDRLKGHFSGLFLNTGKTYRGFLSFPFKPLANKTAWRFRMGSRFFSQPTTRLNQRPRVFLGRKRRANDQLSTRGHMKQAALGAFLRGGFNYWTDIPT